MNIIKGKVVIITGASSGIGESTAKLLASKGAIVVLAARREKRLKALQEFISQNGGSALYKVTDVSSKKEVEELADLTLSEYGTIDAIVNNAGVMLLSPLHEQQTDEWDEMIDVNIKGVLYGINAVLPTMRSNKKGHIINVSSVAGHILFETGAVYCGTKFAVRALTEGLRQEEYKNNIRTTIISPGNVQTELPSHITHEQSRLDIEEFISQYGISPKSVARAVAHAIGEEEDIATNEIIIRPTRQQL